MSPSSPPPPSPFFALVFISVLQLMRGNVHGISSGRKLRPHVYAFTSTFNIYHKNPLLSQAFALYTTNKENKRQIPSSLSIHLRLRGGTGSNVSLANETFKGTVGEGIAVGYGAWRPFCEEL